MLPMATQRRSIIHRVKLLKEAVLHPEPIPGTIGTLTSAVTTGGTSEIAQALNPDFRVWSFLCAVLAIDSSSDGVPNVIHGKSSRKTRPPRGIFRVGLAKMLQHVCDFHWNVEHYPSSLTK